MLKVYSMERCPYCDAAKALLKQRGIPFEEEVLSPSDDASWDALISKSGMKTVPQIFAGEKLIGGYQDLVKLDRSAGLEGLK